MFVFVAQEFAALFVNNNTCSYCPLAVYLSLCLAVICLLAMSFWIWELVGHAVSYLFSFKINNIIIAYCWNMLQHFHDSFRLGLVFFMFILCCWQLELIFSIFFWRKFQSSHCLVWSYVAKIFCGNDCSSCANRLPLNWVPHGINLLKFLFLGLSHSHHQDIRIRNPVLPSISGLLGELYGSQHLKIKIVHITNKIKFGRTNWMAIF